MLLPALGAAAAGGVAALALGLSRQSGRRSARD
jgi:hypothetical protein